MKIYTRTGDQGTTGLLGAARVPKNDLRIVVLGSLDELNAALGIAHSVGLPDPVQEIVCHLQNRLFQFGAEVATPDQNPDLPHNQLRNRLNPTDIRELERAIDRCEQGLPPLTAFILPGGSPAAAHLHMARAVCRRAERELTTLSQQVLISDNLLPFLNRTSDLLFVLARTANVIVGTAEIEWNGT